MARCAVTSNPYTIAVLLVVAATGLLLDALTSPVQARLAAYTMVAVVAVYTQLLAVFVLLAHAVVVYRSGLPRRRFAVMAVVIGLAAAPIVVVGHTQTAEIGWIPAPTPASIASFIVRVIGGGVLAPIVILLCVARAAAAGRWLRRWNRRAVSTGTAVVGAWAVVPLAGFVAATLVQPVLVPRYALAAVPGIALGCALLALRAPRRVRGVALGMASHLRRRHGHAADSTVTAQAATVTSRTT